VVFRADILILAGIIGVDMLLSKQLSLLRGILCGAASVALSLAVTIPLDSLLWGRWLWPEGEVLYFNTILNK
jgi:alpha-1,6-mannosyltransferase